MAQPLAPHGGNDRVYTPTTLAQAIVTHYNPKGRLLDPCLGHGAFYDTLTKQTTDTVHWCEIDRGVDFLTDPLPHFDWAVTNPPWSKLRAFLKRAMDVSDNVVFLCLVNAFFMRARQQDMEDAGFAIREILFVPTPPKPWPQTGFSLGAVHVQRGYTGPIHTSKLNA